MTQVSTVRRLDGESDPPAPTAERPLAMVSHQPDRTVVALTGEHDIASRDSLAAIVDEAISLRDINLVIDLSRVEFMSSSTIHIIAQARHYLGMRSRSLTLRSPSPIAQRLLDLCNVDLCHLDYRAQQPASPASVPH